MRSSHSECWQVENAFFIIITELSVGSHGAYFHKRKFALQVEKVSTLRKYSHLSLSILKDKCEYFLSSSPNWLVVI